MYRTVLHIEYLRTRLLKKSSSARNQKSAISEYSVFHCTYTFQKRILTSLYPSGKKGIFVGYSEISKAYRIYFPGFKKIDISRDVTFDEHSSYNNPERDLLNIIKKQKHPEFMTEP